MRPREERVRVNGMSIPTLFNQLSSACAETVSAASSRIVQVHGRPRRPASGVVIGAGRVVTTNHSVEWEDEHLKVRTADGRVLLAEVAGRDPRSDLVLLRVEGLDTSPIELSSTATPTGSLALVVGRTWGGHLQARLSVLTEIAGPIRSGRGAPFDRLLSLGVGPYPGFSGSAVLLPDGGLAALATAGIFRGNGLAVPASVLREVAETLEQHGSIKRGYLGVTSQPVRLPEKQRSGRKNEGGLLVLGVAPGSPADNAGVIVGDVLVAFDGHDVDDPETLLALLTSERVGHGVALGVLRGGVPQDVTVTVGERGAGE
jgi:serine protease DegQ